MDIRRTWQRICEARIWAVESGKAMGVGVLNHWRVMTLQRRTLHFAIWLAHGAPRRKCAGHHAPWGYGSAWFDAAYKQYICYPIPLNIIANVLHRAWVWCVAFGYHHTSPHEALAMAWGEIAELRKLLAATATERDVARDTHKRYKEAILRRAYALEAEDEIHPLEADEFEDLLTEYRATGASSEPSCYGCTRKNCDEMDRVRKLIIEYIERHYCRRPAAQ